MRLQDNKKGCRVKKNYSLMLYQRVTGDFYTINSEGKFTLPWHKIPPCSWGDSML